VREAFISDNEIGTTSGFLNAVFVRPKQEELEDQDPDLDLLEHVEELHNGHRGWGYSERREGMLLKL
jgi:hypothetical protein